MRRLMLVITCIAALGVGAAVWISGASATVTHRAAPRLRQLSPRTLRVPLPSSGSCYVGLGSCSEHPCVEFVSPRLRRAPNVALPNATRCRPTVGQAEQVGDAIVSAQPVR